MKNVKIMGIAILTLFVGTSMTAARQRSTGKETTSVEVDKTPNIMFVSNIHVDLTPERRYVTAPAQTDTWDKMFKEKRAQLKEKKQGGTHGVELKITGADSLELVNAPLKK